MNEWARGTLDDVENLTEARLDEVLKEFMKDFRENSLETKGWPTFLSAYMLSKVAMTVPLLASSFLGKKFQAFE